MPRGESKVANSVQVEYSAYDAMREVVSAGIPFPQESELKGWLKSISEEAQAEFYAFMKTKTIERFTPQTVSDDTTADNNKSGKKTRTANG